MYQTHYMNKLNSSDVISLLSNVFNSSHDGLFVCDTNGYPLLYNEAILQITGLTHEFFDSSPIFEAVHMKKVPNAGAAIAIETKQTATIIIDYFNGKKALVTSTPYFNENKEILYFVSNLRDITEMNQIQKDLEKTKQMNQVYQNKLEQLQDELAIRQLFVFESKKMEQVASLATRFSKNDLPILLLGESGVGKDVLANYIHEQSQRKGSFIKINCGAIPEHLLESELFGYEKGAFTGANISKKGLIELAHEGTLFLDEIGDLPYSLQVKLLNVLQDYKIRRLGSTLTKEVNVRIIAATNVDIELLVKQKKFRLDLYYRINVLSITIPPLRERKEDITNLVIYFLHNLEKNTTKLRI